MTDLRTAVNTFFRHHEKKLKSSRKFGSRKGKLHLHVLQVLQVLQSGQWGSGAVLQVLQSGQCVSVTGVIGWTVG